MRNTDRIVTSHVGSLPRPHDLLDALKARLTGNSEGADDAGYQKILAAAVDECVARQAACGVDIVTDGEFSKPGFFIYAEQRLAGFEPREKEGAKSFAAEREAFPEYYEEYMAAAMFGGNFVPVVPLCCVGPVSYIGQDELNRDLANLRTAVDAVAYEDVFVPSTAPSGVGWNDYYGTEEEYLTAVAEALRTEYAAIVDAGFQIQIDDPFLSQIFSDPALGETQRVRTADLYVETINHALRDIPRRGSVSTLATASTKVRGFMNRSSAMSSITCCGSTPVSIRSRLPIPATSTTTMSGRTPSLPTAKRSCRG